MHGGLLVLILSCASHFVRVSRIAGTLWYGGSSSRLCRGGIGAQVWDDFNQIINPANGAWDPVDNVLLKFSF